MAEKALKLFDLVHTKHNGNGHVLEIDEKGEEAYVMYENGRQCVEKLEDIVKGRRPRFK